MEKGNKIDGVSESGKPAFDELETFEQLAGLICGAGALQHGPMGHVFRGDVESAICALNRAWAAALQVTKARLLQRSQYAAVLHVLQGDGRYSDPAALAIDRSRETLRILGKWQEPPRKEQEPGLTLAERIKSQIITIEEFKADEVSA